MPARSLLLPIGNWPGVDQLRDHVRERFSNEIRLLHDAVEALGGRNATRRKTRSTGAMNIPWMRRHQSEPLRLHASAFGGMEIAHQLHFHALVFVSGTAVP